MPTTALSSIRANSFTCSLSSPDFVCRSQTRSPARSRPAAAPVSGLCTSPAISRETKESPSGQTSWGSRSGAGGPEATQPPPSIVAVSSVALRTMGSAKAAAGAGAKCP